MFDLAGTRLRSPSDRKLMGFCVKKPNTDCGCISCCQMRCEQKKVFIVWKRNDIWTVRSFSAWQSHEKRGAAEDERIRPSGKLPMNWTIVVENCLIFYAHFHKSIEMISSFFINSYARGMCVAEEMEMSTLYCNDVGIVCSTFSIIERSAARTMRHGMEQTRNWRLGKIWIQTEIFQRVHTAMTVTHTRHVNEKRSEEIECECMRRWSPSNKMTKGHDDELSRESNEREPNKHSERSKWKKYVFHKCTYPWTKDWQATTTRATSRREQGSSGVHKIQL